MATCGSGISHVVIYLLPRGFHTGPSTKKSGDDSPEGELLVGVRFDGVLGNGSSSREALAGLIGLVYTSPRGALELPSR